MADFWRAVFADLFESFLRGSKMVCAACEVRLSCVSLLNWRQRFGSGSWILYNWASGSGSGSGSSRWWYLEGRTFLSKKFRGMDPDPDCIRTKPSLDPDPVNRGPKCWSDFPYGVDPDPTFHMVSIRIRLSFYMLSIRIRLPYGTVSIRIPP